MHARGILRGKLQAKQTQFSTILYIRKVQPESLISGIATILSVVFPDNRLIDF